MINKIKYIIANPLDVLPHYMTEEFWELWVDNKDANPEMRTQVLCKALTKYTGYQVWVSYINFHDYKNVIFGSNILKQDFDTDIGIVCVCRLTDSIKQRWKTEYNTTKIYGAAIFKMSENIDVEFQQYSNWTVIKIYDMVTGNNISSIPYEDACSAFGLPFKPED